VRSLPPHPVRWPAPDQYPAEDDLDAGMADDTEPDVSERITLIEFTWMGLTGAQPVIFVAREWLQ